MDLETLIKSLDDKRLILIPVSIIALSLIVLGWTFASTGSPVKLGMEFTGGTMITLPSTIPQNEVVSAFQGYPLVQVREMGSRYEIQIGPMSNEAYTSLAKEVNSKFDDVEIKYIGPVYSKQLQLDAPKYLLMSFLLMALVVFIIFRQPVVSAIIVVCALADITIAAGLMTAVGVELSLATVAALLMLIGYSVDTDILLTVRVLKRKGLLREKMQGAMRTGLMMTSTTLVAIISLIVVSSLLYHVTPSFTKIDVIADISTVLFFGLLADMINTWITNVQLLKWFIEKNPKAVGRRGGK